MRCGRMYSEKTFIETPWWLQRLLTIADGWSRLALMNGFLAEASSCPQGCREALSFLFRSRSGATHETITLRRRYLRSPMDCD